VSQSFGGYALPRSYAQGNLVMTGRNRLVSNLPVYGLATALGLGAAGADLAGPFGDDTAPFTAALWFGFAGLLGIVRPSQPWRWAVVVGVWLPLAHLALRACGRPAPVHPDTLSTILLLLPVALAVCLIGSYAGAFLRRASSPGPS
jgi:hypothetical protein